MGFPRMNSPRVIFPAEELPRNKLPVDCRYYQHVAPPQLGCHVRRSAEVERETDTGVVDVDRLCKIFSTMSQRESLTETTSMGTQQCGGQKQNLGDSEVADEGLAPAVHQYVPGLEVPVDHMAVVQELLCA